MDKITVIIFQRKNGSKHSKFHQFMNHNKLECFYCKFLKEKALLELQAQLVKPFKNHWGKNINSTKNIFFVKKDYYLSTFLVLLGKFIIKKKSLVNTYGQKHCFHNHQGTLSIEIIMT